MITAVSCVIIFSLIRNIHAGDENLQAKLLREASGISDDDLREVMRKKGFTLYDCYVMAVYKTERLALAGESAIQADAKKIQALGALLPRLYLRGTAYYPGYDSRYASSASQRNNVTLNARQSLLANLGEWQEMKASRIEYRLREYQLRHNAGRLIQDIAESFYTVLRIEKGLLINGRIIGSYNDTLREIKRRASIGRSRWSDVLRINAQIYKLEADNRSMRNGLTHARLMLAAAAGLPEDYTLIDDMPYDNKDIPRADYDKIIDGRWDVRASVEQLEYTRTGVAAAWGGHLPNAYIEGSYYLYQQKIATAQNSPSKSRDYTISLGVELPIFSWGAVTARIKEAESIKRQAVLNLENTRRLAMQELIDSCRTLESSKTEMEAYKKALSSAEDSYRAVSADYRMRLVTVLDVLTSLLTLQTAHDDYERIILQNKLDKVRLE